MIKKIVDIYKTRFEAYGGEHMRDTFSGQLRYELGKLSYLMFITMFVWLPYIPNDLQLHQYPRFAVSIRVMFSVLSIILIILRFTNKMKHRPDIMFMAAISYLYLSTALVTATSGGQTPAYIGGFVLVIMLPAFAPFPLKFVFSLSTISMILYFLAGSLTGMALSDASVRYAITDLIVAYLLNLVMSLTLYRVRRRSWEQRMKLQDTISQNEKSLTTIFDLASKAEASARHKSEFLAKMSHEIRTPMNAITGMAELALRENMSEKARENILTIKQASANLLSIVNDILDISKIESGKMEIVPGDYMLDSLINDVISIIRMRVVDTQVRFVANIDCNIPNALFGDETRIRQILLNILNNAVKYTKEGHVSLTIMGESIDGGSISLIIEIDDSGIGMKAEDIEKLFGDFVQIDVRNQKHVEGTGLGLAITHNLVKAMGGDISVESEYGKGSTFTVRLSQKIRSHEKFASVENPEEKRVLVYELREIYADSIVCTIDNLGVECTLVSTDMELREQLSSGMFPFVFIASTLYENAAKICSELKADAVIALLAGFGEFFVEQNHTILAMPVYSRAVANLLNGASDSYSYGETGEPVARFIAPGADILVVDDINTNLSVTEGLLLPYKMKVDLCLSGMGAIEAAASKRYDLIFMDHMMPGVDGIEAAKKIRELDSGDPYYANLPIVVLTANAISGTKEMFLENGFNDFLSKPIDTIRLNAILEKWIPKEKQIKGAAPAAAHAAPVAETTQKPRGMGITSDVLDNLDLQEDIDFFAQHLNVVQAACKYQDDETANAVLDILMGHFWWNKAITAILGSIHATLLQDNDHEGAQAQISGILASLKKAP